MIDGVWYWGRTPYDAKEILDNSQNRFGYKMRVRGHLRGHVSTYVPTERSDSVEMYFRKDKKTAFLSREDQNKCAHLILTTPIIRKAMTRLNDGLYTCIRIFACP